HRRGDASARVPGHRPVRQATAAAERRAAAPGGAMEVRLQEHQVDRGDPLYRAHAADRVESPATRGVWLLQQRQSGRGPSALEPEDRAPHRRHREPAVRRPDSDPALQRLRGAGGGALFGDGFEEMVLMRDGWMRDGWLVSGCWWLVVDGW